MRATKDSGVEWLGDIPADWDVRPCWSSFRRVKQTGFPEEELLSVYRDHGVVPKSSRDDNHNVESEDLTSYQLVRVGDMVMNKMKAWQGSIALSDHRGIVSPAYFVYRPTQEFSRKYFHYLLRSAPYVAHYNRISKGVRVGQWDLDPTYFRTTSLIVPPVREQRRIADFLDRETAKIDALIAKQEQLISTLDERRKSIIVRYVSRGINPESVLVRTGNHQVSTIPNHWSLKRLRHFAQIESGAEYKDLEIFEDGFPVYGSGGAFAQVSRYMYNGESVLFGRKGTIDKPLYVNGPFWTVDTMYWTRFTQPVNVKFVYYWATTVPFGLFTTSTALPSMKSSDIKNFFIAMPPLAEQGQIVRHLDAEVDAIDSLIKKSSDFLKTLGERRQALISAAVTGKLEVSDGYS